MTPVEKQSLESLVARTVGTAGLKIRSFQPCSGGCIHRAHLVEFNDGAKYFVKSSPRAAEMFALEAQGLAALSAADVLRVPALVAVGCLDGGHDCLVLEAIESSLPVADFWERFGRGLAQLHRRSVAESYGWNCDNYLGSSHQRNLWNSNWVAFFAEQRLGYQLRMARQRGLGSGEFYRLIEQLIAQLDKWLTVPEDPPSLLHGDLWSGNFLVDENGLPVLFDPAVYYGRREADLAMPLLFGGFPATFFAAYQEFWPLESGWQERMEIYQLYHLLNHLNLFGSGYLDRCLDIARRLV